MENTIINKIVEDAIEFTKLHIRKVVTDDNPVITLTMLHGMATPSLDLISYTTAFFDGVVFYQFYKEYGRFPGRNEAESYTQQFRNLLKDLAEEFNKFKIDGQINIINPDSQSSVEIPVTLWCNACKQNVKVILGPNKISSIESHSISDLTCPECNIRYTLESEHK